MYQCFCFHLSCVVVNYCIEKEGGNVLISLWLIQLVFLTFFLVVFSAGSCGALVSYVGCLCTCWITFHVGYLCVARPSGRL